MTALKQLKKFVFDGMLVEDGFNHLEQEGISVHAGKRLAPVVRVSDTDFSPKIIHNANKMASIYVLFFCLENAVRELITERLLERYGIDWWETCVPKKIKERVQKLKEKEEKNKYYSNRSSTLMGYTLFGDLAQIIIAKWEDFTDLFPEQSWITSRFNDLEISRNIIMHTGILPEIEVDRIESISRDWLRQVG